MNAGAEKSILKAFAPDDDLLIRSKCRALPLSSQKRNINQISLELNYLLMNPQKIQHLIFHNHKLTNKINITRLSTYCEPLKCEPNRYTASVHILNGLLITS